MCAVCRSAVVCTADGGPGGGRRKHSRDAVYDVGKPAAAADVVEGQRRIHTNAATLLHR